MLKNLWTEQNCSSVTRCFSGRHCVRILFVLCCHFSLYQTPRPLPCISSWPAAVRWRMWSFSVLRLAPVSKCISLSITRPCCRTCSTICMASSGRAARSSLSRSTFFLRRCTCWCRVRRKKSSQGCQFGDSARSVPCV